MAYLAAQTNVGTRKRVNEDSCCIEVAQTALGEVLMAIVCDGVGGLSRGDIASSTVVDRFVRWFERTLPALMGSGTSDARFDLDAVRVSWDDLLHELNATIRAFGLHEDAKLGTTFTGIIAGAGRYLVGHVGDCRAYRLRARSLEQITADQTAVARRLAAGEITEEEARRLPRNVISQAVGTQQGLAPEFYVGDVDADDLFVLCCDGAYHRIGNEGLEYLFNCVDFRDEAALDAACNEVIQYDLEHGERDNLTVLCFSGALADALGAVRPSRQQHGLGSIPPELAIEWADEDDDAPTMLEADEAVSSVAAYAKGEDDVPTMVEPDEDDAPTMLESDDFEDDAPTMIEEAYEGASPLMAEFDEDDAPTMIELDDAEDDAPTMVEMDEDDAPTMVEDGDFEDDAPTMVEPDDFEDDAPTMVELDEDDAPTMVEGGEF